MTTCPTSFRRRSV